MNGGRTETSGRRYVRPSMDVSPYLFDPDPNLAPFENWERALNAARRLIEKDRSFTNLAQWAMGCLYKKLRAAPEAYGLDEALSQEELAAKIGCSAARVCNGVKLFRAYTYRQVWQFAALPNEVLVTAARIPEPDRSELFGRFVTEQGEWRFTTEGMMDEVVSRFMELRTLLVTSEPSPAPTPLQLPIKSFRSAAVRTVKAAQRLRCELGDRRFWVVRDDLDRIEEAIASVKGEIAQLKETVRSAR